MSEAGDVACVPKQYLTGAFVFGEIAAAQAGCPGPMTRPDVKSG